MTKLNILDNVCFILKLEVYYLFVNVTLFVTCFNQKILCN